MKERILIWGMLLSAPAFIIGHLTGLSWLTFLGAFLVVPFGIIAIGGIIWTLIDR